MVLYRFLYTSASSLLIVIRFHQEYLYDLTNSMVLIGSAGTGLRSLKLSNPKHLIPVASKPVSQHVQVNLGDISTRDVAIVLGEHISRLVRKYYRGC